MEVGTKQHVVTCFKVKGKAKLATKKQRVLVRMQTDPPFECLLTNKMKVVVWLGVRWAAAEVKRNVEENRASIHKLVLHTLSNIGRIHEKPNSSPPRGWV